MVREYYGNVALFLLRGYAILQLSYILLTASGHGNFQQESLSFQDSFQQQYTNFRECIDDMLREANRDLWKCDPNPYLNKSIFFQSQIAVCARAENNWYNNFIPDDYYTAVTNFWQGYIDNEINLNGDQSCSNTCEDYRDTKHFQCNENTMCAHNNFKNKTCNGRVVNCTTIDDDFTACSLVWFNTVNPRLKEGER